jgi:hypothetical protein
VKGSNTNRQASQGKLLGMVQWFHLLVYSITYKRRHQRGAGLHLLPLRSARQHCIGAEQQGNGTDEQVAATMLRTKAAHAFVANFNCCSLAQT